MRFILFLLFTISFISSKAQTILNNAVVKAKMEMYSESNGNVSTNAGRVIDIEIYLKDSMSKVSRGVYPNFNHIAIRNVNRSFSTHLVENNLGEKISFDFTALDKQDQKRNTDIFEKSQQENIGSEDGTFRRTVKFGSNVVKNIVYVEESKTINGIDCKKAIVTMENLNGDDNKVPVWYMPGYLLPKGVGGEKGMMSIDGLKGMPVYYEIIKAMNVAGSEIFLTTIYQVTEINTPVKIDDSTFRIPLGYTRKTYAEWEHENPGGIQKTN